MEVYRVEIYTLTADSQSVVLRAVVKKT